MNDFPFKRISASWEKTRQDCDSRVSSLCLLSWQFFIKIVANPQCLYDSRIALLIRKSTIILFYIDTFILWKWEENNCLSYVITWQTFIFLWCTENDKLFRVVFQILLGIQNIYIHIRVQRNNILYLIKVFIFLYCKSMRDV